MVVSDDEVAKKQRDVTVGLLNFIRYECCNTTVSVQDI